MKKILLCFCLFVQLPFLNYGQSAGDTSLQRQSNIFDHYTDGSVLLKSGGVSKAPLNYCSFDQTILFEKDGTNFTLTNFDDVDTVYIADKKFVPVNKSFYEVTPTTGQIALLISYTSKFVPMSATTDHNGTSVQKNGSVSNTVSNVYVNRSAFKGNYAVEIAKHYWLKDFKNVRRANNLRDFLKVFREITNPAISEFAKNNNINFQNEADLVKLVNFGNKQ